MRVSDVNRIWGYAYQPVVARRPRPRDLRFPVIEIRESGGKLPYRGLRNIEECPGRS
jgi:hypothetical protein